MRFPPLWSRTVRQIQRGTISITSGNASATATLSPTVNTTKAVVLFGGHTGGPNNSYDNIARIELTNGSTVTAYRTDSAATSTTSVGWQVIEFY